MTKENQVLIVGGGPVGLLAAHALTSQGIDVRIIDAQRLKDRNLKEARGITIGPRTLEILDSFGLKDEFLDASRVCRSFSIRIGKNKTRYDTFDFWDRQYTEYPYFIHMPQWQMENIIKEKLDQKGVEHDQGVVFHSLEQSETDVITHVSNGSKKETIKSNFVIGCDGVHSEVRKAIGSNLVTNVEPKLGIYQVDAKLTPYPFDDTNRLFYVLKNKILLILPLFDDYMRIVLIYRSDDRKFDDITSQQFDDVLKEAGFQNIKADDVMWVSSFKPASALADILYNNRVFIAGDSVHPVTPITAQGVNTGFQDVHNLCWKLTQIFRNPSKIKILGESYNEERHQSGQQLMNHAKNLTMLMDKTNEGGFRGVFKKYKFTTAKYLENYLSTQSQMEVKYDKSPILQSKPSFAIKLRPGKRFPDYRVCGRKEKSHLYTYTSYQRHLVLIFSGGSNFHHIEEMQALRLELKEKFPDQINSLFIINKTLSPSSFYPNQAWPDDVVIDTEGIHEDLKIKEPCAVILRPDNFVSGAFLLKDQGAISSFLGSYLL